MSPSKIVLCVAVIAALLAGPDTSAQEGPDAGDRAQPQQERQREAERAKEKAQLRQRFIARTPQLKATRLAGQVGERWDGLAALVEGGHAGDAEGVRKLVDEENEDRRRLYRIFAEEEGVTPDIVAIRAGKLNFERAEPGTYLQGRDGKWVRKS